MEPIKAVILILLAAIVVSLGKAMFHLSAGGEPEDSAKMARALTFRIGLSIALFAVLMLAWYLGQFNPHVLQ
jgi:membrane associated rhomboid family serine protease